MGLFDIFKKDETTKKDTEEEMNNLGLTEDEKEKVRENEYVEPDDFEEDDTTDDDNYYHDDEQ